MKQPTLNDLKLDRRGTKNLRSSLTRTKRVKITINVDEESLMLLRTIAGKTGTPYQRILNQILRLLMSEKSARRKNSVRLGNVVQGTDEKSIQALLQEVHFFIGENIQHVKVKYVPELIEQNYIVMALDNCSMQKEDIEVFVDEFPGSIVNLENNNATLKIPIQRVKRLVPAKSVPFLDIAFLVLSFYLLCHLLTVV